MGHKADIGRHRVGALWPSPGCCAPSIRAIIPGTASRAAAPTFIGYNCQQIPSAYVAEAPSIRHCAVDG